MTKVMLYASIIILGAEFFVIINFWEIVVFKVSQNWWLSLVSFFGKLGVWGFLKFLGSMIFYGIIELLKVLALDSILKIFSGSEKARKFKAFLLLRKRAVERKLKRRWLRYNKTEKVIIILAFSQVLLISIGAIFYLPTTRKHGAKTVQKKLGKKFLLRFVPERILLTFAEWLSYKGILGFFKKETKEERWKPQWTAVFKIFKMDYRRP